jgi:hypothetical protein
MGRSQKSKKRQSTHARDKIDAALTNTFDLSEIVLNCFALKKRVIASVFAIGQLSKVQSIFERFRRVLSTPGSSSPTQNGGNLGG